MLHDVIEATFWPFLDGFIHELWHGHVVHELINPLLATHRMVVIYQIQTLETLV